MKRKKNDYYPTPRELVKEACSMALSHFPLKSLPQTALDPGCGTDARFARQLAKTVGGVVGVDVHDDWSNVVSDNDEPEIRYRTDFLSTSNDWGIPSNGYDLIVGNPPFSKAIEFVRRGLDLLSEHGVMLYLLRLGFAASRERRQLMEENPPSKIVVLDPRPSFTNNGKTDGTEYAFFLWDGNKTKQILERRATFKTEFERLNWSRKKRESK